MTIPEKGQLQVGDMAPDFELPVDENSIIRLSSLRGHPVVLYFYPKDATSGCTLEAHDFSKLMSEFMALKTQVFGISPDSLKSHIKFTDKESLNVPLLSDEEKKILNAYGVWVEKSMQGRKYMGVERSTFLINAEGKINKIWHKVKVAGHADEVLSAIKEL